ncbi:MAG TPA: HEAT repeat domain-containing protein [Bryobacteraceae bacterium]|jgi:hypothetical protein|nr:HEAT repeat domain-containing protein [Bryobacteraceae bacterium]
MKTILVLAAVSVAFAQTQPEVKNAQFETRSLSGSLDSVLRANEPAWFGYAITTVQRGDDHSYGGCELEDGHAHERVRQSSPVKLEGSREAFLLYRVENNEVKKIRLYSSNCAFDAGRKRFVWVSGVPMRESLEYLAGLVRGERTQGVSDSAIFAIAQHDATHADELLEKFAQPGSSTHVREQAIFWMGASRGARGAAALRNILQRDSDDQVRAKAVFALSISSEPGVMSAVIEAAEHDPSPHVRGQALFWLAQKAGKKAAGTIENAMVNDPDRAVKRQAVFALSQLPKDESVPKLIEAARTQKDPEVRKQAFFWLGQSNDPRALAFFRQVLKE